MLLSRLIILFLLLSNLAHCQDFLKKTFKFSTFYVAANGGTSISDLDVYSVTDGVEVMKELGKIYVDTPSIVYNSIAGFPDKVIPHFTRKYFSFVEAYEMGDTKVRPENMRYEVIIHMGDVDPSNPV